MRKILITKKIPSLAREILEEKYSVDTYLQPQMSKTELLEAVKKYDGILSSTLDFFDKEVFDEATKLQVISNYAIGLDNIDVSYAKSKQISVYNLPDVVTQSTADLTFAIFLSLIRKIPQAAQYVKDDQWKTWIPELFSGEELYGKTFGIFGLGRTGKAVAQRALGFGLKVVFYHYKPMALDLPLTGHIRQVSLDEFLEISDYVSLHIPLKKETKGLVNAELFKKMKKKPVLINMARGSVVNTDDLVHALKTGQIRGAALDVTDPEPISGSHPLCQLDNCLILPHIGTETVECRREMAKQAATSLLNHVFQ